MQIDPAAVTPTAKPTLAELAGNLRAAREGVHAMRVAPVFQPSLVSARQTLLCAMEAYADELTARRLPIPSQLRDDLRLQRDIRRHPNGRSRLRHG